MCVKCGAFQLVTFKHNITLPCVELPWIFKCDSYTLVPKLWDLFLVVIDVHASHGINVSFGII